MVDGPPDDEWAKPAFPGLSKLGRARARDRWRCQLQLAVTHLHDVGMVLGALPQCVEVNDALFYVGAARTEVMRLLERAKGR